MLSVLWEPPVLPLVRILISACGRNGRFVNPDDIIVPREEPVDKAHMDDFRRQVALSRAFLHGETELAEYTPAEWAR